MNSNSYAPILQRIHAALEASRAVFMRFTPGAIETEYKVGHDPVTEADRALDAVLRKELLREGEGWLSEESVDDPVRLQRSRVWVVDPLDGTREFVKGIPEFCVSIGFVENGRPVAGGIYNPATDETFLGSMDSGVTYNGKPSQPSQRKTLNGALVLASRSEVKRGEWKLSKTGLSISVPWVPWRTNSRWWRQAWPILRLPSLPRTNGTWWRAQRWCRALAVLSHAGKDRLDGQPPRSSSLGTDRERTVSE